MYCSNFEIEKFILPAVHDAADLIPCRSSDESKLHMATLAPSAATYLQVYDCLTKGCDHGERDLLVVAPSPLIPSIQTKKLRPLNAARRFWQA
jgi:hypothetical protein